jgi:hypothetical protein
MDFEQVLTFQPGSGTSSASLVLACMRTARSTSPERVVVQLVTGSAIVIASFEATAVRPG